MADKNDTHLLQYVQYCMDGFFERFHYPHLVRNYQCLFRHLVVEDLLWLKLILKIIYKEMEIILH